MVPSYGLGSTVSRIEPPWECSSLYNSKPPEIPGTHFINLGSMKDWVDLMVLTIRLLDWDSSTLTTRSFMASPSSPKSWIGKKENNIVCSLINSPSNLVNNVFASVYYLGFNIKLLFFFT